MFVSRVLSPYENIASVFIRVFWNAGMLFILFSSENSQPCDKIVKFYAAKAIKIIKILSNADISKKLLTVVIKNDQQYFFNLKTLIKTKYNYHSFSGPNVRLARLQMELCRAANIFAAR